jgi:tetratricopeptide (TPR) repeat protein
LSLKLRPELDLRPQEETKQAYINISRVPSKYFTGRSDILNSLHQFFQTSIPTSAQVAVLIGLGGIGKTQIALKYFEQQRSHYSVAFFVDCSTEQDSSAAFLSFAYAVVDEKLRQFPGSSYSEIVKELGFSALLDQQAIQSMAEKHRRVVEAVKMWLGRQGDKFLVIFDGADDPGETKLSEFIPHHHNGDIIITTRDADAKAFGQTFFIEGLPQDDAIVMLSRTSNQTFDTPVRKEIAQEIVTTLGKLPLAIDQAGGYLANSDSAVEKFLPTYALHAKSLLSKVPNDGMLGYRRSAFTTWDMSFERILSSSPPSASLLQVIGFVSSQDICELLYNPRTGNQTAARQFTVFSDGTSIPLETKFLEGSLDWILEQDTFSLEEAFNFLVKLCLIRRSGESHKYEIHPVVHVWIRERLKKSQQAIYARDAMVLVARALPLLQQGDFTETWGIYVRLHRHIQVGWRNVKLYIAHSDDRNDVTFLSALNIVATSFRVQGQYDVAEEVLLRTYAGYELLLGHDNENTLDSAVSLASIYDLRGNIPKAEELYRLALKGLTKVLGPQHRKTLSVLHQLAGVVKYKGKPEEAEKLYKEALEGRRILGEEDLDTLETMDALASLYDFSGRVHEATPLRLSVLDARERLLGPAHPETLTTALSMGYLYVCQGKNEQALALYDYAFCEYEEAHDC